MNHQSRQRLTLGRSFIATLAITLAITLTSTTSTLQAQESPTPPSLPSSPQPWPGGIIAPWRTIGIDPDDLRRARPPLKTSLESLARIALETPTSLLDSRSPNPPIKRRLRGLEFFVGTLKKQDLVSNQVPPSALIEPVWCNLRQYHVLFLTLAHSSTNQLLASTHHGVEKKQWDQMAKNQTLDSYLREKLAQMLDHLTSIGPPPTPPSPSALQLALLLKRESTRRDEGSTWCLNLLMEESLAGKTKVIRSLGADNLLALGGILGQPPTPKRPTRYVTLDWNSPVPTQRKQPKPPPPTPWLVTIEASEGVFAKSIPPPTSTPPPITWNLGELRPLKTTAAPSSATPTGGLASWNIDVPVPILNFINEESQALNLADQPMVVKTLGAWAYLDRGRGWGLAMGDRLVADDGQIKGHVVRYFGPELSLKSNRGFPVHEGAILYIRKGQGRVRSGTVFAYDTTTFPTPWPPSPTTPKKP